MPNWPVSLSGVNMESNFHVPVLLEETIDLLALKPNSIVCDMTLGRGGHSSEILRKIPFGHLYGVDRDEEALRYSEKRLSAIGKNFTLMHSTFSTAPDLLKDRGIIEVDAVLYDLGVSSPQFDNPERGFSYRFDAPLDMRMDRNDRLTAEIVVNTYTYEELRHIIQDYGEERYAALIARAIVRARETKPVRTTFELVDIIKGALPAKALVKIGHPAKQTFLGIRYEVNREKSEIEQGVERGLSLLAQGGRLAVITFNSLEDGLIKNMFKKHAVKPATDKWIPELTAELDYELVTRKPIAPTLSEIEHNPRAKPAKLRVIERKKDHERKTD